MKFLRIIFSIIAFFGLLSCGGSDKASEENQSSTENSDQTVMSASTKADMAVMARIIQQGELDDDQFNLAYNLFVENVKPIVKRGLEKVVTANNLSEAIYRTIIFKKAHADFYTIAAMLKNNKSRMTPEQLHRYEQLAQWSDEQFAEVAKEKGAD